MGPRRMRAAGADRVGIVTALGHGSAIGVPPSPIVPVSSPYPDPGLAAKVAFLSQPGSYPEPTRQVQAIQTHMSWVFLTDRHAWKLKKPVRTGYLDYGSTPARRRRCADEVRLNRRLSPDVYLGVVPLTLDPEGGLRLGAAGRAVDWLVKMRRLPAERMLDHAIRTGTAHEADVREAVAVLARFYRQCRPVVMTGALYRTRLAREIATNQRALGKPDYRLPTEAFAPTCAALSAALAPLSSLLDARAENGRIVEGHGDLRPEHVCLLPEPRIIDCLEFSRSFRILDSADELAYLGLECERLGAPDLTHLIFDAYAQHSGDVPPEALVHFYQALRACLRAKIALWHLDDPGPRDGLVWTAKAHSYLALAREHAARMR